VEGNPIGSPHWSGIVSLGRYWAVALPVYQLARVKSGLSPQRYRRGLSLVLNEAADPATMA
jgi:hypothetical protein